MKITIGLALFLCFFMGSTLTIKAYEERNLLQQKATKEEVRAALVMNRQWVQYPSYADRSGWEQLFSNHRNRCIEQGVSKLSYQWQVVKATDYLEYERTGERVIMEKPFNANIQAIMDLLLAELAEGKGRFMDQLINGVYHTCEMTGWALSAHYSRQPSGRALPSSEYNLIDLTSGDLSSLLAWTYYFMKDEFDKVDPEIARRLKEELKKRTLDPYMEITFWWSALDYKGQMVNNWNPWCNSSVLLNYMLLEDNPERLADAVFRSMQSVDKFINYTKSDGACEEGPSYWGHAAGKLLDYLELLSAITGGKVDIFNEPMIKNMGEYIANSFVGNNWVVNFADASAKNGSNYPHLIFRYGKAVNSDQLKGFAAIINSEPKFPHNVRDLYRTLEGLRVDNELLHTSPKLTHQPLTWYPETEFCYITTKDGLFFAAKGGYNDESHNHNDVGTFSVWMNNTPVLIDAGVGTYTRQTFSNERYTIWTMQSNYHNLPVINGVGQKHGKTYRSKDVSATNQTFKLDISDAYTEEAKVEKWIRSYRVKGKEVHITDDFILKEAIAPAIINFMTWGTITEVSKGELMITVENVSARLKYDPAAFNLTIETIDLPDTRLSNVWGNEIYRISLTAKDLSKQGKYIFTLKQQ